MAGRPPKIPSVEQAERISSDYFADCDKKSEIYTMTGLAIAFDIERTTLLDYYTENHSNTNADKDILNRQISLAIKRAVKKVAKAWELLLSSRTPVGAIFWLKNHGWSDRVEQDITSKGQAISPNVVMFGQADPLLNRVNNPRQRIQLTPPIDAN